MDDTRKTQRKNIDALLRTNFGKWVPLFQITKCAAQYNARIHELREEVQHYGLKIENRRERVNGQVRSWYRLIDARTAEPKSTVVPTAKPQEGWADLPLFSGSDF